MLPFLQINENYSSSLYQQGIESRDASNNLYEFTDIFFLEAL